MHFPTQLARALNWVPTSLPLPTSPSVEAAALQLPQGYLKLLSVLPPGEGFVGHEYLRLYAPQQLPWLNMAYQVSTYLPGHCLFGSNGCGEAYLFGPAESGNPVSRVPFIPLDPEYRSAEWPTFAHFLSALVASPALHEDSTYPDTPNPDTFGKEVHEVRPVALGGNPADPTNTLLVGIETHVALVAFWNRAFQTIRSQSAGA